LLILIMVIGVLQDKIFTWLDREFFPYKYQAQDAIKSSAIQRKGFGNAVIDFALVTFGWIVLGIYFILMLNEYFSFLGGFTPLSYLFGSTTWVINLVVIGLLLFKGWKW